MKTLFLVFFILLSSILTGCANSMNPTETVTMETSAIFSEETVAESTEPDTNAPGENKVIVDLDGDGKEEKLVYQDGSLRRVLVLDSEGERIVMEEATMFLCDDKQTVLRFGEGSGGHTWFYYRLENGEMVPVECLVYHWADGRFFRSTDYSAQNESLAELTEEEYRQAMETFPCTEGKNSFLGHLF